MFLCNPKKARKTFRLSVTNVVGGSSRNGVKVIRCFSTFVKLGVVSKHSQCGFCIKVWHIIGK